MHGVKPNYVWGGSGKTGGANLCRGRGGLLPMPRHTIRGKGLDQKERGATLSRNGAPLSSQTTRVEGGGIT